MRQVAHRSQLPEPPVGCVGTKGYWAALSEAIRSKRPQALGQVGTTNGSPSPTTHWDPGRFLDSSVTRLLLARRA